MQGNQKQQGMKQKDNPQCKQRRKKHRNPGDANPPCTIKHPVQPLSQQDCHPASSEKRSRRRDLPIHSKIIQSNLCAGESHDL